MTTTAPRDRIPFILYGDGPRLHSGLARIARDIGVRLYLEQEELGIRFAQVGVDYPGGWHWQGWDFYGFQPSHVNQGREAVAQVVEELAEECEQHPIVLMIMDPARCYDLLRPEERAPDDPTPGRIQADFWGYFPLDAENLQGTVGGPAGAAVQIVDRALAYGRYGAGIIQKLRPGAVQHLPHGLDLHVFTPTPLDRDGTGFAGWAEQHQGALKIGCVATNQPRKDLGLYIQTLAHLKRDGLPIAAWLHTDRMTGDVWDVGELARTCGLYPWELHVSDGALSDQQLAARYTWSDVTIAPGLGEGFGYPIVESLACGTPVVHGRYAGGVELIPEDRWLVEPHTWRLESVYALRRPVLHPWDMARAVYAAREAAQQPACAMYCRGAVAGLDWLQLWPRWRSWIRAGLRARRDDGTGAAPKPEQPAEEHDDQDENL